MIGRPIRAFGQNARPDLSGVALGDLAFERSEDKNVNVKAEEGLVVDRSRARAAGDCAVGAEPPCKLRDVESIGVVGAATDIGDPNHAGTALVEKARGCFTNVAKALDSDRGARKPKAQPLSSVLDGVQHPLPRGVCTASRATDCQRLAGHHARHGVALVH